MSAFTTLRALINAQIKTNGQKAITGQKLNGVLIQMVDELGAECQFGGLVLPSTSFTAGDFPVAFLATAAGTYTAFGGAVLDGSYLHIFAWDGSAWSDTATDIPAGALEDYAKKDGYYASLTAGAALNLVGRGSVPAQYLFRTTGGTADVGTGSAVLSAIKGRSIVWNQLVQPGVGSVATISGHKYLTRIAGVDAIVTSTGDAILVDDASKDNVHDLTLLGLGDITIAQFRALFPLLSYAHNAGAVLPFAGEKLVTTGENLYNPATGTARLPEVASSVGFKIQGTYTALSFLADGAIEAVTITPDSNGQFTTAGAGVLTVTGGNDTDTMVYVYWSGEDKVFQPYEKHELAVNPATLLDVDGNLVFPYGGMHGVGTAFDSMKPETDGFIHYANRVFARVDLGDLTWQYVEHITGGSSAKSGFYATLPVNVKRTNSDSAKPNAICAKYELATINALYGGADKSFSYSSSFQLCIADSAGGTDPAAFKTAMDGVYLYYEVATPAVVELAEPIAASYYANDWGTEEWQPENGTEPYTAPCNVDVQYAMNAVDILRNLPRNYIGAEDFDTYNAELAQALASVGITMTYARTFNQQTDHHEFTITMAQSE